MSGSPPAGGVIRSSIGGSVAKKNPVVKKHAGNPARTPPPGSPSNASTGKAPQARARARGIREGSRRVQDEAAKCLACFQSGAKRRLAISSGGIVLPGTGDSSMKLFTSSAIALAAALSSVPATAQYGYTPPPQTPPTVPALNEKAPEQTSQGPALKISKEA